MAELATIDRTDLVYATDVNEDSLVPSLRHALDLLERFPGDDQSAQAVACILERALSSLPTKTYGLWTVVGEAPQRGRYRYLTVECGGCGLVKEIRRSSLLEGDSRSCSSCASWKHGHGGMRAGFSAEYITWNGMVQRCHNPNNPAFADYGGRGITVYAPWRGPGGFVRFFEHVGPKPSAALSLDRINNEGNYEPGNLRWADHSTQMKNRRGHGVEFRTRNRGKFAPGSTRSK